MRNSLLIILFIASILVILGTVALTVLYFVWDSKWPIRFTLENTSNTSLPVNIYVNGYSAYKLSLDKGEKKQIVIGNNVQNMTTRKPLQRAQVRSLAIELVQDGSIKFSPENLPSNRTILLSTDLPGYSPIKTNQADLDNGIWTRKGYYGIALPNGVQAF